MVSGSFDTIVVGQRIRRLRESRGIGRRELAEQLNVDVSAIYGWEAGRYVPRVPKRFQLAESLGVTVERLFDSTPEESINGALPELTKNEKEFVLLLAQAIAHSSHSLRVVLAWPRSGSRPPRPVRIRDVIEARLKNGSLEVQHVEVVYSLFRLKEIVNAIFRFDGLPYWFKGIYGGAPPEIPIINAYLFDDRDLMFGFSLGEEDWEERPSLRLSGDSYASFFQAYWNSIWYRGKLLNGRGAHDLSAVRDLALQLGLDPTQWDTFVAEARALDVDDAVPPQI